MNMTGWISWSGCFYDLKPSLLAVADAGLHVFARLIIWQDVENSVEMGPVEQEYSISSHTVLMSTPDTHACARARARTQIHKLRKPGK